MVGSIFRELSIKYFTTSSVAFDRLWQDENPINDHITNQTVVRELTS